jgi:hypothetical protein
MKVAVRGLGVALALLLIGLLILKGPKAPAPSKPVLDPWTHVLGRIARGGPQNADGAYAASYSRIFRSRAGVETTMLLVDEPARELELGELLLEHGFIREASFHLRNVTEYYGTSPEAAPARERQAECARRSALEQISPLSLVLTDGKRLLTSVPAGDAGLTGADQEAISEGLLEHVARRHPGTPVAFALLYEAALAAKGEERARLYREALALIHVPALPLARPADDAHRAVGFIDDALHVNASARIKDEAIFFPDSEFETGGAYVANRIYYQVEAGALSEAELKYKLKFLAEASAVVSECPELARARVYWGVVPADILAQHASPDGELDQAYTRAAGAVPFLKIDATTILTKGPELAVNLDWANLDRVKFRFSRIEGLPLDEVTLKRHLDSIRHAKLPVAYEHEVAPAAEIRLPLREPGTWRVTAEAAGLTCAFFAVRTDPKLEALVFPTETVLLTNLPGLSISSGSKPLGTEKDGAIRIGPVQGKFCASHVDCCKDCGSCYHHHTENASAMSGAVQVFGCDGKSFFRAKATTRAGASPQQTPSTGPVLCVYADRPVYRAGDTLRFRGILRVPSEDPGGKKRFDIVPKANVVVSILRDKETLFNRAYVTGEFGTFAGEFTLPLSSSRAEYALKVSHDPVSAVAPFEVLDYRKSDYVITLESKKGSVAVRAGYAWGAPVEGTQVKAFIQAAEVPLENGSVAAAAGDSVRVVLLRGEEELASKSIIHREPVAASSEVAKEPDKEMPPPSATGPSAAVPGPAATVPALRTAKKVYGRGETIEVELAGPDGEALVVLGDVRAHDWRRVSIRDGRGVARFQTTPVLDPGITVFAVMGGAIERLPLEINAQRMRIDIVPDAPVAKPGEDVGVTIRALPGAEVSLAAVDEALFMIREDACPDLYGAFYPARPADMSHATFENFTFEGDSQQAERIPADPRFRPAVRARDRFIRKGLVFDSLGVGGGGGGGGRYGGRFGGRENLVARGGGTRATESAVLANLKALAERQLPDGSWGPGDTKTEYGTLNSIGRASLALLSFLGAGYSHLSKDVYGPYCFGDTVKNGLKFMMRMQDAEGCVGPRSGDFVLNHALATATLSEAYGMSATQPYKSPAQSALLFLVTRQAGDGGWHPAGGSRGEAPVTGLAVMAMKSGQLSELDYGQAAAMNASRFFRTLTRADGSCPVHRGPDAAVTPLSTAAAMLSFILLDNDKREPRLAGVKHLVADLPSGARPDFGAWYMVALALFQYDGPDGPYWKQWNQPLKNALVPTQSPNGLWAADAPAPDAICMTGFAGLTLEVYYRYANVFGAAGGGGSGGGSEGKPLAPPPAIRVYFPDTALWIPDLVTDSKGEARATLRMPDSITTIRFTARGVTKDTAVGEGVGRVESRQPFFVNLKTPAFFVAGDEAEIRAELFNYTGGIVDAEPTLSGDGFTILGDARRRVNVGTSCESVSWRVRVLDVDAARFLVRTERDAVEKTVPVKPIVPPVARNFRGPVVVVPEGEKPVDLVVRISPKGSSLSKVLEALRFLNEYPHG